MTLTASMEQKTKISNPKLFVKNSGFFILATVIVLSVFMLAVLLLSSGNEDGMIIAPTDRGGYVDPAYGQSQS